MTAPATASNAPRGVHPITFVEKYAPAKIAKAAVFGYTTFQMVAPLVRKYRTKWGAEHTYTITVHGTDFIYPDLHEWILSMIPEDVRKALIAETEGGTEIWVASKGKYETQKTRTRLRYDGDRVQTITMDGHQITVSVSREEMKGGGGSERLPSDWRRLFEKIVFTTTSPQGRDAIVNKLDELLTMRSAVVEPPKFKMMGRYGNWDDRADLPQRELSSIILKRGQLERIVDDMGQFLAAEPDYARRGLPWHRGYLFHGAPGTGKSSIARALASHFELNLFYMSLSDMKTDTDLLSLVSIIEPRSILLLEDVDVYHAATQRDEGTKTSLSALLNSLDGIWTPWGLITIMTTNNRDVLDSALIRPGRVDVEEELTNLDPEQATDLVNWFYNDQLDWHFDSKVIEDKSPAWLLKILERHKDDPTMASTEIWGRTLHSVA